MPKEGVLIRIGTSGWHYPHWRGFFYPADLPSSRMLAFYSAHFDVVEINVTHYRLPPPDVLESWCRAVPDGFTFAVKASRYLTHFHRLKPPFERYDRFFKGIEGLGDALGPVLLQLPPRFARDDARLDAFLGGIPRHLTMVVEFRHPSWETPPVLDLLQAHGAGLCVTDLAGHLSPVAATSSVAYVRLHGPRQAYKGTYDDASLAGWAAQCQAWEQEGRDVYVFFDNDDKAMAVGDALRLKRRLG